MESKSYQALLDFIANKLRKIEGALPNDKISIEINNAKLLLEKLGPELFGNLLSVENFDVPSEVDLIKISRDLETFFDVKMDKGILIKGDDQQKRDTLWWSSIWKQKSKKYYWNRLKIYLNATLPPEVIKTLDVDTDIIMNNLENPSFSSFSRYGMVVGHVQSGKTGNFSALVCKAADAGYKFIVVISGDKNNLRTQTQERLNETFVGWNKGTQFGVGKGNSSKELLPISLTTVDRDFNRQDADKSSQGLNFDNVNVPILLVVKKNTSTLNNVIEWLQKQYVNTVLNHGMLVIDDESDYASINTKDSNDPTAINKKLRTLLGLFHKSAYVAYTATPYANIFIDHQVETSDLGKDLFPKDFIYALDAPSNYFGARKIFIDSERSHLVSIDDYKDVLPLSHKSDYKIEALPESMLDAIRLFTLAISVRHLRGQALKHNSMLIHATRFTEVHKQLSRNVESYLDSIKESVIAYGKLNDPSNQSDIILSLESSFNRYYPNVEYSFKEILYKLNEIVHTIVVREVHQKTSVPLEYRKDSPTNAIVIGGTSVSRGFTVEHLTISYFLRNTVFYDTLLQMGRWFGYRTGYEDLCRIFMPENRIEAFSEIIQNTEELYEDFKIMSQNNMTPSDFGLAVRENPNTLLQITARNKLKNVKEFIHSMRLDGRLKESSYLCSSSEDILHNRQVFEQLINILPSPEKVDNNYIWRHVDRKIILEFLERYRVYGNDRLGITSRMPIKFIEEFVKGREIDWDVSLHSGKGKETTIAGRSVNRQIRKFIKHTGYVELQNRSVSSGSAESIGIEDKNLKREIASKRTKTREHLPRPLLMLHLLEENDEGIHDERERISEILAFGVSFPGNVASKEETITLKVNTVYFQNLLKELEIEENEESDD